MTPRARFMLMLVAGVIAAGAITVALGTAFSVNLGGDGAAPALLMVVLLAAVVALWLLRRR
ncbi:hypothetical protein [Alkalilacustris brevis]|uniref:hypothetical protein n=1 Tax=Alkalilacustris brevis TaxID=2026338 RepID=UPI000E0D4F9C|nr:hypothetical protein [Alkalilacustris brevis]